MVLHTFSGVEVRGFSLVGYEDRGTPYRVLARAAEHRECRFWRTRSLSLALFAVDLTVVAMPFGIEEQESGTALEAREEEGGAERIVLAYAEDFSVLGATRAADGPYLRFLLGGYPLFLGTVPGTVPRKRIGFFLVRDEFAQECSSEIALGAGGTNRAKARRRRETKVCDSHLAFHEGQLARPKRPTDYRKSASSARGSVRDQAMRAHARETKRTKVNDSGTMHVATRARVGEPWFASGTRWGQRFGRQRGAHASAKNVRMRSLLTIAVLSSVTLSASGAIAQPSQRVAPPAVGVDVAQVPTVDSVIARQSVVYARLAPAARARVEAAARDCMARVDKPVIGGRGVRTKTAVEHARDVAVPGLLDLDLGDVESLVALVMAQAARDADADLKSLLTELKLAQKSKEELREALARRASGVRPVSSARPEPLDALSEANAIRLQMLMERRAKYAAAISGLLKKISDTQSAIVGNLK